MTNRGLLIVLSGPSGAGKGTICKGLLQKEPNLILSVSATTRSPRKGEIDGKSYFFIDMKSFETKIEKNEFLEYARVYDNCYGTPTDFVIEHINKGNNVILEIDIDGALQVKEKFPNGVFVFILPPSMKELKNRIIGRGTETEGSIKKRFKSAIEEISFVKKYDYCVVNDDVESAVKRVQSIIEAEKCKVTKNVEDIIIKFKEELEC